MFGPWRLLEHELPAAADAEWRRRWCCRRCRHRGDVTVFVVALTVLGVVAGALIGGAAGTAGGYLYDRYED